MESKRKNKNENNKDKDNKEELDKIKEENQKDNINKDIKNKIKEENKKKIKQVKKLSPWIFLQGENLQGFHLTFILMIIIPISTFFIIRNILSKFNFSRNQQDVYGVIGVLISVWLILVSYTIYYFRNDFYTVFCKKKDKEKTKDKNE